MSGPNLPLQPLLPSLQSPKPALQEATLHALSSQARSQPELFPSCCFRLLAKSSVKTPPSVKLLLVVQDSSPKAFLPPSPPHPARDSPSSRSHLLISTGPLEASTQAASMSSSGKTVVHPPAAYPPAGAVVAINEWAGRSAADTGRPRPLDPYNEYRIPIKK